MTLRRSFLKFMFSTSRLNLLLTCFVTASFCFFIYWNSCEVNSRGSSAGVNSALPREALFKTTTSKVTAHDQNTQSVVDLANTSKTGLVENIEETTDLSKAKKKRKRWDKIDVDVNGEKKLELGRITEADEVYIPFAFIKNYFELQGDIVKEDGKRKLEWKHTYVHEFIPSKAYSYNGSFMWFQYYNVEHRARVKCVSGKENVPVSTQWDAQGYYYPIQISQYGLSHYSMLVVEDSPKLTVLENAEGAGINWAYTDRQSYAKKVDSHLKHTQVLRFKTKGIELDTEGISLTVDSKPEETILSFHLKLTGESCISVTILIDHTKTYSIHYISNMDEFIKRDGQDIFYSIGRRSHWSKLTRDLVTDLQKGIGLSNTKVSRKVRFGVIKVQGIVLRGQGFMDNLTLSSTGHADFFKAAADWLVAYQDSKGGWPVQVKRVLLPEVVIEPGWYSAMGQGQAISLLTRAYSYYKEDVYINAAVRATKVYTIPSKDNGIVAHFLGTIPWYEEYPTKPSLFVLNGFIYSLIGLYDLKMTARGRLGDEAARLFHEGMNSLKTLLPLYDSGSGSFYDLRHVTMKLAPNIARWDYHNVHCSQLHLLYTIDPDPFLKETMTRWRSYLKGHRSKHN